MIGEVRLAGWFDCCDPRHLLEVRPKRCRLRDGVR